MSMTWYVEINKILPKNNNDMIQLQYVINFPSLDYNKKITNSPNVFAMQDTNWFLHEVETWRDIEITQDIV